MRTLTGKEYKSLRRLSNLTRAAVAEDCEGNVGTLERWENEYRDIYLTNYNKFVASYEKLKLPDAYSVSEFLRLLSNRLVK